MFTIANLSPPTTVVINPKEVESTKMELSTKLQLSTVSDEKSIAEISPEYSIESTILLSANTESLIVRFTDMKNCSVVLELLAKVVLTISTLLVDIVRMISLDSKAQFSITNSLASFIKKRGG